MPHKIFFPALPGQVFIHEIGRPVDRDCLDTVKEALNEIQDTRFAGLVHGRRSTRNRGCSGPLCKKALRDWQREREFKLSIKAGKPITPYKRTKYARIDPILEHFMRLSAEDQLALQAT